MNTLVLLVVIIISLSYPGLSLAADQKAYPASLTNNQQNIPQRANPTQAPNTQAPNYQQKALLAPGELPDVHPPGWHPPRFKGFVDLHTHPLSYLGFGGKLIYGGLDLGSYLPTDSKCVHDTTAKSMSQALGTDNPIRAGWGFFDNPCGDDFRKIFFQVFESINNAASAKDWARGFSADYDHPAQDGQDFVDWPTWDDIDHQKMWVDSIYRAYTGGLRVMIALAVNNKTLADCVRGPGDKLPDNDKDSAMVQIEQTKQFVNRHNVFMEVAYSSADLERIVKANKLAVVLGVEVDNIGDINRIYPPTNQVISNVIHDLYNAGVRYIFPIHVLNNPLGGTAVYKETFNVSNYYETGSYWSLECSQPSDGVTFQYSTTSDFWDDVKKAGYELVKLGGVRPSVPSPPLCAANTGHVNKIGLTPLGEYALKEMMRLGMLIDIDHMSNKAANRALEIAEGVEGGYPLFSGHNNIRGGSIGSGGDSEIARTRSQYKRIANLHGMAGVGTAELTADKFIQLYVQVVTASQFAPAAFGTDTGGLVKGMRSRAGSNVLYDAAFPMSRMGSKQWDYNKDGVAHYGMIADYVKDMQSLPGAAGPVDNYLMNGADYFLDSWLKAEKESTLVK